MAQACEGSRHSLHASPVAAAVASTKVGAPSLDECTRASAENTVAPVWQQSARDGRVKSTAQSSRKFSFENFRTHANKSKGTLDSETEFLSVYSARAAAVLQVDEQRQFFRRCQKFCYAKIVLDIASLSALSVTKVATSRQRATATRSLRASASAVAVWATWLAIARPALRKPLRRRTLPVHRTPLPRPVGAQRKYLQ